MCKGRNQIHFLILAGLLLVRIVSFAQTGTEDSAKILSAITVRAFEQKGNSEATAVVKLIENNVAANQSSWLTAFNNVPGARMEERSPGSLRINIRGSSLRSPFGVRNVKIYWNGIPITDPGGNTYFNQFAINNFSHIELFKGPASSMYGAGTGGLLLLQAPVPEIPTQNASYNRGSYGLQQWFADLGHGHTDNGGRISYNHSQSEGYRQQTRMNRHNATWVERLRINQGQSIEASVLFTDLYYQTPGALTLREYEQNPAAARPATGNLPSARDAKAAIFQKTFVAGVTHQNQWNPTVQQLTTVYGAFARVENSAVRNYERRIEPSFGGRTVLTVDKKWGGREGLHWSAGLEVQQGTFNIQVADNKNGKPDSLQTNDDINTFVYSLFTQAIFSVREKWFYTAGVSFNKSRLAFTRLSRYPVVEQLFSYKNELAPRISILKKFEKGPNILATASKGFSPPTIAELLPSTGVINNNLQAEHGWNYELTGQQTVLGGKLRLEATGYFFNLRQALVQRRDAAGADYFENAGRLNQKGLELEASYHYLPLRSGWLNYLIVKPALAYSHYRYKNFIRDLTDYSGNTVPGIPATTFSLVADARMQKGFYVKINYYQASRLFLNDANTATATPFHLLGALAGWKKNFSGWSFDVYTGGDNLLNENYSLGNDINAAGGRYYNAAPLRNYYLGIRIQRQKHQPVW